MKVGFIGTGNMGAALVKGYSNEDTAGSIFIYDKDTSKAEDLSKECGVNFCDSIENIMESSDIVILAVKPNIYEYVLKDMRDYIKESHIIVSIAAGISISYIEGFYTIPVKVVRTMPNTPALVNEGMTALSKNNALSSEEFESVIDIFKSIGKTEVVEEKLMDVVTGISGSSPAYVYMFIEALADGAVLHGMPRDKAYIFAAQAVLGSAKMVIETGKHPGELKDMVCSPGGTTIEAVAVLERKGMRSAIIDAVDACVMKNKNMNK